MPASVSRIIDKVARQTVGKDWAVYAGLLDRWVEIAGRDYAEISTPVKLTFPHQPQQAQNHGRRSGGTLYIRLPKGLAMEFTYKSEQIRQRVNGYFGYEAIARIVLDPIFGALKPVKRVAAKVDKAALDALTAQVEPIENNDLREALGSFGEAMLTGSGRKPAG